MSNRELTNAEVNFIDDVVRRLGGGALLRCELLTLAFYVKQSGDDRERDQLARFFRGEIEPNCDYNEDGTLVFVPTERAA